MIIFNLGHWIRCCLRNAISGSGGHLVHLNMILYESYGDSSNPIWSECQPKKWSSNSMLVKKCQPAALAAVRLRICTGSSDPLLPAYAIMNKPNLPVQA